MMLERILFEDPTVLVDVWVFLLLAKDEYRSFCPVKVERPNYKIIAKKSPTLKILFQ